AGWPNEDAFEINSLSDRPWGLPLSLLLSPPPNSLTRPKITSAATTTTARLMRIVLVSISRTCGRPAYVPCRPATQNCRQAPPTPCTLLDQSGSGCNLLTGFGDAMSSTYPDPEAPGRRHLAGSIFSVGLSRGLTLVAVAVTSIVITRMLGASGIGTYAISFA